eukprot:349737-Chlamydomonas_euryale.AAC.7
MPHPTPRWPTQLPTAALVNPRPTIYNSGQLCLRLQNGSDRVNPLVPHLNDRQVQKGRHKGRKRSVLANVAVRLAIGQ